MYKLNEAEKAIARVIRESYEYGTDFPGFIAKELYEMGYRKIDNTLEDELHRVRVLGIGSDRTAVEVLEDLIQGQKESQEWENVERD